MTLGYLRIYSDSDGETHFEDVTLEGDQRGSGVSSAVSLYSTPFALDSLVLREVVVDHGDYEFHVAPRTQFVIQLAGEAELEVSDGSIRRIGPGDVVLLEDINGKGHVTRKIGVTTRRSAFLALRTDGLS
jgi:hypothetical protein